MQSNAQRGTEMYLDVSAWLVEQLCDVPLCCTIEPLTILALEYHELQQSCLLSTWTEGLHIILHNNMLKNDIAPYSICSLKC